jgi:hypothetical protein
MNFVVIWYVTPYNMAENYRVPEERSVPIFFLEYGGSFFFF